MVTVLLVSGVVSVGCRLFWSAVKVWVWKSWWNIFVVFIGVFDMPRPAVEAWALHVLHCCLVDLFACAIEWLGAVGVVLLGLGRFYDGYCVRSGCPGCVLLCAAGWVILCSLANFLASMSLRILVTCESIAPGVSSWRSDFGLVRFL